MSADGPRLGVLCMDDLPRRARPVLGDYPDLYAHLMREQPVRLTSFEAHRGELPSSATECDGWLVGGGRRSVYEDEPWIREAEGFVRSAAAAERPVVGVCFGHQLVASALGGEVVKADVGWGIGALEYDVERSTSWFDGGRVTMIASHQDQVTRLPDDGEVWASSDYCPIAGMTVGERIWTMQGHPEFTGAIAERLYVGRVGVLEEADVERALATLGRPLSNDAIASAITRFLS